MTTIFPFWLTKTMVQGVSGFHLDAYLVALEGWRRGLTLKWYDDPSHVSDLTVIGRDPLATVFSLHSDDKVHFFQRSRGDFVANDAVRIGTDKQLAKEHLIQAKVPVPLGSRFRKETSIAEMIEYGLSLGFPLVAKPTYGSLGEGVHVNLRSEEELRKSIQNILELGFDDLIIEQFIQGEDVRVYVLDNRVLAATKRIPANVTGDGKRTIEELIAEKNKIRKESPYLMKRLIPIDKELIQYVEEQGLSLHSVPKTGEKIYLREVVNVCKGGDPIDITEEISPDLKQLAVRAIQAIPGLKHAGVDLLWDGEKAVVLEINPTAVIGMHLFPVEGKPRNIPAALIDYYFPESIGRSEENLDQFFDYPSIYQMIRKGVVKELTVRDLHTEDTKQII